MGRRTRHSGRREHLHPAGASETVWSVRNKPFEGPRGSAIDYIVSSLLVGKRIE